MPGIARMVGYSINNYFGKVFKASKGITSDKFRKQSTRYDFVREVYETPKQIYKNTRAVKIKTTIAEIVPT